MNVDSHLDPEIASIIDAAPLFKESEWEALEVPGIPAWRLNFEAQRMPLPVVPIDTTFRDYVVPGPKGDPDVAVRVYSPSERSPSMPCLYWIHGGGFIMGSGLLEDPRLARWSQELNMVIVSVDYRLAPETPFPGPFEDCYAGLQWTSAHADELHIDANRILVGGSSAGGGMAAGLALAARDRKELAITYQLLLYPMLDDRQISSSANLDTVVWSKTANRLGWSAYLGGTEGSDHVHPYAAPARAEDLSKLPPAFITVGTLDLFRDEDIDYAQRLLGAGVETELHVHPGAPHAFDTLGATSAVGQRGGTDIDGALRRAILATDRR